MARYPSRKRIFDLVGEAQTNTDGVNRQNILRFCSPGGRVVLQREPDNPYDPNAILVVAEGGPIGYIRREDAAAIAPALDGGMQYQAVINELTGGLPDFPSFGCKLCITWEGQRPLASRPIREEQSLYGAARRSGCAVLILSACIPIGLALAYTAA